MEAMTELCDLVAQNPTQFSDKLSWICNGCPQPDSLLSGSPPRVSRSQLNAILAVARFLSKCSDLSDPRPKSVALGFLRAVPASFSPSFWPQSYSCTLKKKKKVENSQPFHLPILMTYE
ncbi:phosphatidylinositol 4-kinase alpha 1 [Quercus suber]|uniref:Phosphatidylinositol 4-kinase alpha 1 n=1 Tax=Quercus suber TaxID=58331 RepID=A0AAW0LG72_QUESU